MIIYKVHTKSLRYLGGIQQFCRSYDSARDVIRQKEPKAKVIGRDSLDDLNDIWVFKNWIIQRIDIKPDKAGICEALNNLIEWSLSEDPPYEPYSVHSDNWSPEHKLRCF